MKLKVKEIFFVSLSGYFTIFVSIIKNIAFAYLFSKTDYAIIQSYILYSGYSWLFLLGFTDGLFIEFKNFDYKDIPKPKFRAFTVLLLTSQLLVSILIFLIGFFTEDVFIWLNISIAIFLNNLIAYYSVINQFTCRFNIDVIGNTILNFLSLILIVTMILLNKLSYQFTIVSLNIASLFNLVFLIGKNLEITFGKCDSLVSIFKDSFFYIKTGFFVMISVTLGRVIMSIDKLFIDNLFSKEQFASYSFSISIITMFFAVLNVSSRVILPYLSRIDDKKTSIYYNKLNNFITILSCIFTTSFFIIKPLVLHFVPKYEVSLDYLAILFPCLIFKIIFSTISDNYYKLLNSIKQYIFNTIIVLIISIILNLIFYKVFKSVQSFSFASVITFFIWYIINEYFFIKKLKLNIYDACKRYIILLISAMFFYVIVFFNFIGGGLLYVAVVVFSSVFLFLDNFKYLFLHLKAKIIFNKRR